jgi:hypothetical protein
MKPELNKTTSILALPSWGVACPTVSGCQKLGPSGLGQVQMYFGLLACSPRLSLQIVPYYWLLAPRISA